MSEAERDRGPAGAAIDSTVSADTANHETLPAPSIGVGGTQREIAGDRYLLGPELARGGMGRIREARDQWLDRPVAVKQLLADSPGLRRRFEREALITARLQHPGVVPVYEGGRLASGEPFYVMKIVSGRPLNEVIARAESLADRLALLGVLLRVAETIAYAHSQRVIHRDLKPSNILVGDYGETVVIDWGLAKDLSGHDDGSDDAGDSASRAPDGTVVGAVLGTPAYMPPEQARGEPVDERADVYAIGAMMYHLLTGVAPYNASSSDLVLAQVLASPPPSMQLLEGNVPGELITLVNKAMAREPSGRYATAAELAADLRRYQTGHLVQAHQYSRLELVRRWLRRNRAPVLVATPLLVIAIAIGLMGLRGIVRERNAANEQRELAERRSADAEVQLAAADELVSFILFDLRDRLEPLGHVDLLEGVGGAVEDYYRALPRVIKDDMDAAALFRRWTALEILGDAYLARGDVDAAERAYKSSFDIVDLLADYHAGEASRQRSLATSHLKIGDVALARGNEDAAIEAYRKALAIAEREAREDATNDDWAEAKVDAHMRLGGARRAFGASDEAVASYRRAVKAAAKYEGLVLSNAGQLALVSSRLRLGEVLLERGDYQEAVAPLRESLTGIETLLLGRPDNPRWRAKRAMSLVALGIARRRAGDNDGERALADALAELRDLERHAGAVYDLRSMCVRNRATLTASRAADSSPALASIAALCERLAVRGE